MNIELTEKVCENKNIYNKCYKLILSVIMGQTSSNHSSSKSSQLSNLTNSVRKSKRISRNNPTVHPLTSEELKLLRHSIVRGKDGHSNKSALSKERPTTTCEARPSNDGNNIEHQSLAVRPIYRKSLFDSNTIKVQQKTFELPNPITVNENITSSTVVVTKENEFYTVGDGYHKTENCYYRSANGNFYKLPSDSYHKMTDGCFVKTNDGTFCRLEVNSNKSSNTKLQQHHGALPTNVKSHVMKFLKRSKSHTPATMKEMQKEREMQKKNLLEPTYEDEVPIRGTTPIGSSNNRSNSGQNKNNKVVVTMMENGGLPIVAISKADRKNKDSNASSVGHEKSRSSKARVCIVLYNARIS